MNKKFIATILTLTLAATAIAANSVLVAYAFSNNTPNIAAEDVINSDENSGALSIEVKDLTEPSNVPADVMSKDEVAQIGLKAIEDNYGASTVGLCAVASIGQRIDMDGDFWSVSFMPTALCEIDLTKDDTEINEMASNAFWFCINARTGEIVEMNDGIVIDTPKLNK